jgi:hypothetical protein
MEHGWHPDLYPNDNKKVNEYPTREALGSVAYIATRSRPDILFAVARLQREMHQPTYSLILAIERILLYLNTTKFYRIGYTTKVDESNPIQSFCDGTWGGWEKHIDTTYRSTIGTLHMFHTFPISWQSSLVKGKPLMSSAESEYVAAYCAATEALSLQQLLIDMDHISEKTTIPLYSDSTACIAMCKNPVNYKRNKQVMCKFHWVREAVKKREIRLVKIDTLLNPSDVFTKAVKTIKHYIKLIHNFMMT